MSDRRYYCHQCDEEVVPHDAFGRYTCNHCGWMGGLENFKLSLESKETADYIHIGNNWPPSYGLGEKIPLGDVIDPYESLQEVLDDALYQASSGKGKERHAKQDEPFDKQKICEITRREGLGYPIGQAIKKAIESQRLGARGPDELLGAINYLAAAVIVMREELRED